MLKKPTPNEVLLALDAISWKRTVFVAQKLTLKGEPRVKSSLVLRRLRDLERSRYITTDGFSNGYYGLEWIITPEGEKFIAVLRS